MPSKPIRLARYRLPAGLECSHVLTLGQSVSAPSQPGGGAAIGKGAQARPAALPLRGIYLSALRLQAVAVRGAVAALLRCADGGHVLAPAQGGQGG